MLLATHNLEHANPDRARQCECNSHMVVVVVALESNLNFEKITE